MKFIRTCPILLILLIQSASAFAEPLFQKDTVVWTNAMAQALGHPADAREEGDDPSAEDQALLEWFKPKIYIAPNGAKPIDFYVDYLPYTVVRRADERDKVQERAPSRETLQKFIYDPQFYLEYIAPKTERVSPTAYARLQREEVNLTAHNLITTRNFIFLKYHYVFPNSGLPGQLSEFKEKIAGFIGEPEKWQELEHSSVYVVLDENERPLAIMLQQYDYFRTYIVGEKEWKWPMDGKVEIAFSLRSNQPYKLPEEGNAPVPEFAVLNFKEIPYLISQGKEPLLAGKDLVYPVAAGAVEVDYRLEYLAEFDPLYISRIPLGRRHYILNRFENPFRRSSLGIDFCTWPQLADLGNLMQFWYLVEGNKEQGDFMRKHMRSFFDIDFEAILALNAEVFGQTLKQKSPIQ